MSEPVIGISCQVHEQRARVRLAYVDAVRRAGGVPILLSPPAGGVETELVDRLLELCDGLVLTGGDDPSMERYGVATHPAATVEDPLRQAFDEAVLSRRAAVAPDKPLLAICLGMQLLALSRGGTLNQHLADDVLTHADHLDNRVHPVVPEAGSGLEAGLVTSYHHQAVRDAGDLRVTARAHDGVIEAIDDPEQPCCVGVQWHPERTLTPGLGDGLFARLVRAAGARVGV